jgi:tripartite-type tricarboxylate transporter receptor subunit TctC
MRKTTLARASILGVGIAFVLLFSLSTPALSQAWPQRTITLVVPYAAGGSADVPARFFARELSAKLGQQVIVENRPGAGGAIGTAAVYKAPPDGHTLTIVGTGPAVLNKLLGQAKTYDPDQMTPIIMTTEIPHALIVNAKHAAGNLQEFVANVRRSRDGVIMGYGGTTGQMSALLFAAKAGINPTLVNYRGTAPLVNDVLANQIDSGFPVYVPQVSQLKSLGVTGERRLAALPNVPTMREMDLDVVATTWNIMLAPPGTPREIVARINGAMNEILKDPEIRKEMDKLGANTLGGTPEQAAKFLAAEAAKYKPIIEANEKAIQPE